MSKRAIYLSGTTALESTTTAVGTMGLGAVGAGVAHRQGTSATALAAECAPPQPEITKPFAAAWLIFCLTFFGLLFLSHLRALHDTYIAAGVALFVFAALRAANAKAVQDNAPKLAQYEMEWRCLTCAGVFVP
ncbi:MAG TPA: hypothetical protein VFG49_01620 [Dyella sp.]|uniref:hypothetical protein n=1 Tax=Dyella sp. TaxID=1869338 RepID=UPI002D78D28A|nr:hypothetical protein [Dyella sp.]HET6552210.1 hypothetical protein [Dyella sp.]